LSSTPRADPGGDHGRFTACPLARLATIGVTTGVAAPTNSTMLLRELDTQRLPEPSIAIAVGLSSPPPSYPDEPVIGAPEGANSAISLPTPTVSEFATQTLPEPSMAMPMGKLSPPPVKPLEAEIAVPLELNSLTLLPP